MALIAMVAYDPPGESRTALLRGTLESLSRTVDFRKHRMFVVSNGICDESRDLLNFWTASTLTRTLEPMFEIIENGQNIGTARGINRAWENRKPGENCWKIDSDILLHEPGWADKCDECIARDPTIGIIGLKRKDLAESPNQSKDHWGHSAPSTLHMLPHNPGETWLIVEKVYHAMGTCQLYNSALLDKIGYLVQIGTYGFDDSLAAVRCELAGFYSCFYPHYNIDHMDHGGTRYTKWKEQYAGERMAKYSACVQAYRSGQRDIRHGPDEDLS